MSINNLQFTKAKWNAGMTEQNNLATALLTMPEISKTLAYAFGPKKYALSYLTQGMGRMSSTHKVIGNREFRWPLMGLLTKAVAITSLVNGGSTPGINRTTFQVKLAEKLFALGDVLATHSRTLVRVQTDPVQDGAEYIYTFQLINPDPASYVDPTDLVSGKEVSKEFSAFEENSEGGSDYETTPFWFENQMTTMRGEFSMSGGAQTDVMVLQVGGPDKKGSMLWMYEKEYQFMLKWNEYCERMLWYSEYNKDPQGQVHLPGANGRPVFMGSGILEQIAPSNKRTYTTLTEQIVREFLVDLMENARDAEQTKFVGFCGYWFFEEFHKAMKNSLASNGFTLVDTHFVSGSGQDLVLGGQFKTYRGLNGTELTLIHNPLYDNKVSNRKLHPITKKPQESYRCTILDFGMYGGESNVSVVAKGADGIDRSLLTWYTAGSQTPGGAMGADNVKGYMSTMRSNAIDGWSCHFLGEKGIKVVNPLSCGELILDIAE
jgi:hypothetical protein